MRNIHTLLPTLTASRQFVQDLCDAEPPCFVPLRCLSEVKRCVNAQLFKLECW